MKKFMVALSLVTLLSISAPANATTGATGGKTAVVLRSAPPITGNSAIFSLIVSELISLIS